MVVDSLPREIRSAHFTGLKVKSPKSSEPVGLNREHSELIFNYQLILLHFRGHQNNIPHPSL